MGETNKHASAKRKKLRETLWPGSGPLVFDPSNPATRGYAQVPRVVPLVARLVNRIGGSENAGPLYQVLWAQDWGQGIVEVRSAKTLLYEAGYDGQGSRVERTWIERISILERLGFIQTASNGLEKYGFILLVDPYLAAVQLEASQKHGAELKQWLGQFKIFCTQWGVDLEAYRAKSSDDQPEAAP